MIEVAPSLLAADLMNLGRDIGRMLDTGVTRLHFDVMDAHFVPNLSFGPAFCQAIKDQFPACRLDVHLMMDNADAYWEIFARSGADIITVHQEAVKDSGEALRAIHDLGVKAGLSVKPGTKAETLLPYLGELDNILIMTVEPGFGGQEFMPEMLEKIRLLRRAGYAGDIAVDGGVRLENAGSIVGAGANVLVMGTGFFRAKDPAATVRALKELA